MSDASIIDGYQDQQARLDRLESLVGTAYGSGGTIRVALGQAVQQTDLDQMRQEVQSVINFLKDSNPAGD